jgi:Xaa-Pro aminopeptidase
MITPNSPGPRTFADGELPVPEDLLEARWDALSREMEQHGYDALLVAGRGLVGQYGDVFYVSGFPLFNSVGHGYAFLRRGGRVQLVVGKRDQALALEFAIDEFVWRSTLPDAPAVGGTGLIEQVSDLIGSHGLSRGRVGVVGLGLVMPAGDWIALRELQPELELADASSLMRGVKAIKSPRELELYADACKLADLGFETYLERVAPGRPEAELVAAVEETVRRHGALATIIQVLTGRMYTRPPRQREIQPGEVVCCYVEPVAPNGYWVEKGGMFCVGEPPAEWLAVLATAERAYAAAEAMLRPGTRASDVFDTVREIAAEGGCELGIWVGHGVGVDHDLPLLNGTDDTELAPGMVVALHPHICNDRYGAFTVDQYTITEDEPVLHSRYRRELRPIPA